MLSFERAMFVSVNRDGEPKNSPAFLAPTVGFDEVFFCIFLKFFDFPNLSDPQKLPNSFCRFCASKSCSSVTSSSLMSLMSLTSFPESLLMSLTSRNRCRSPSFQRSLPRRFICFIIILFNLGQSDGVRR